MPKGVYPTNGAHMTAVSDEHRRQVLEAVQREADLDGMAIVTANYLGDLLDLHRDTVGHHIRTLAEAGAFTILSQPCYKSGYTIQFPEDA